MKWPNSHGVIGAPFDEYGFTVNRKSILFIALIAFSCTTLLGQKYVISLVHGDQNTLQGIHEHIYDSWDQLELAQDSIDAHHLCSCECHGCFVQVDGDQAEVYSFKTLNELPTTNLLLGELQLSLVEFTPVKSMVPSDVNWLFDFVDRLERPPSSKLS